MASSRREKNVELGWPRREFDFVKNFKSDLRRMQKQMRVRAYLDFEHWGLPFSLSLLGKDELIMFSVLFVTIAIYTGSMDD
jgi:hypothetical protein